jgi:hypothetical protein
MAAGLTIFQIDLPTIGRLSGRRQFAEQEFPYELECSAWLEFWSMEVHDAVRLGRAADVIDFRFRYAAQRGDAVKAGPVFSRKMSDTEEPIIEIGIVDDAVCLQMFALPRVMLWGQQAELLLTALHHLATDARSIRGAGNALGLAQ